MPPDSWIGDGPVHDWNTSVNWSSGVPDSSVDAVLRNFTNTQDAFVDTAANAKSVLIDHAHLLVRSTLNVAQSVELNAAQVSVQDGVINAATWVSAPSAPSFATISSLYTNGQSVINADITAAAYDFTKNGDYGLPALQTIVGAGQTIINGDVSGGVLLSFNGGTGDALELNGAVSGGILQFRSADDSLRLDHPDFFLDHVREAASGDLGGSRSRRRHHLSRPRLVQDKSLQRVHRGRPRRQRDDGLGVFIAGLPTRADALGTEVDVFVLVFRL